MLNGSLPAFDLGTGQILVACARGAAVLGLLGVFGTLLLRVAVARPVLGDRRQAAAATGTIAWGAFALAATGLVAWTIVQAALLSESASVAGVLAAVGAVLPGTAFGNLVLMQAGAAGLAAIAFALGWGWPAAAASGVALVLQAGHLHAWAMEPSVTPLLVSAALHLLAAGAWLGALPGLLALVRTSPPAEAMHLARRFSPIGGAAVAAIAATAAWQGWALSGGWAGFAGTAYGWVELVKLALFLAMLVCATANRFRLAPNGSRMALARGIAVETVLGLLVIAAASVLTRLEPGMHLQPVWPFAMQPSLAIVEADPAFRREVADAVLALLGAVLLVGLGVAVRWLRWVAFAVALTIAWFALPHFDLLLVDAYPTSFYRSPTGFAATSIVEGATLYPANCASCHGAEGRGDGPAAKGLKLPPADLTAGHLWGHSDGEVFWRLDNGILTSDGEVAMPGFSASLSEDARWALIDYMRANNAGITQRVTGAWSPPLRAPGIAFDCIDGRTYGLDNLRGQLVRLAFGRTPEDGVRAVTIGVALPGAVPADVACVAHDPAVAAAYAIVTGTDAASLDGAQVFVDANGWLRGMVPAGGEAAAAARAARVPLAGGGTAGGHMHGR